MEFTMNYFPWGRHSSTGEINKSGYQKGILWIKTYFIEKENNICGR